METRRPLFTRVVEVLIQDLCHCEHIDTILLKNSTHGLVAYDLPFVGWVLEIVLADMIPYPLDGLRPGNLQIERMNHCPFRWFDDCTYRCFTTEQC